MTRYSWDQAVWRAKRLSRQTGQTVFVVEHDGHSYHDRFSLSLTQQRVSRLAVAPNGNTW
jgi:hypothetical protein